jgi:hypothetical protein
LRVAGIFTSATDSLSPSWRQSPNRYSIRAGRNLPDKEFRYLRTVIVTAAVYRGFGSQLLPPCGRMTAPLNLPAPGRSQTLYVVFDFAEPCVFVKQSLGAFLCDSPSPLLAWRRYDSKHTFFRSYGANLPSSFTRDHSRALEFSSRLPVSVCGTVVPCLMLRGFSWQPGISDFGQKRPRYRVSDLPGRICLPKHPTCLNHLFHSVAHLSSCVTPSQHGPVQDY